MVKENVVLDLSEYSIAFRDRGYLPPEDPMHMATNDPVYIDKFVAMLYKLDDPSDMEFNGEGAYFGRQVTVTPDSNYPRFAAHMAAVEIAYDHNKLVVYTAHILHTTTAPGANRLSN